MRINFVDSTDMYPAAEKGQSITSYYCELRILLSRLDPI